MYLMAIPNTTPTPNELYNGEMKKMSDTELRVVLVVTRATLGWEIDHQTGMRKQEDWLSLSQIEEKTGRGHTAISEAIESCIQKKWVEARDKNGETLDSPEKRAGKKIYYRLGQIFLTRIETYPESGRVKQTYPLFGRTYPESGSQPIQKVDATKETLTKETIQKGDKKNWTGLGEKGLHPSDTLSTF